MQLVITGDGSHTIYVPRLNEHYHSTFGAITESMHIFIKAGFEQVKNPENITVLEIGFGTGLNALLTCMSADEKKINVSYHTLEKFPMSLEMANTLNYPSQFTEPEIPGKLFHSIHKAPWNSMVEIHNFFHLRKIQADFGEFIPDFRYDLVFFDAFAPDKQPEMWTQDIFERLFRNLNPGGILITYCVKGAVKRMLKGAGFTIEKLPGPPGKREILRGRK